MLASPRLSQKDIERLGERLRSLPSDTSPQQVARKLQDILRRGRPTHTRIEVVDTGGNGFNLTVIGGNGQLLAVRHFQRSQDPVATPQRGGRPKLAKPPGSRLGRIARFWYSPRTYRLVFEPTLRDLLDEYSNALAEGQPLKARWVRCRNTFAFWSAAVNQLPISLLRLIYRLWTAAGS